MKKAIVTLAIGDNPMYQAAILSFKHYADKVGDEVDLIVSLVDQTMLRFVRAPLEVRHILSLSNVVEFCAVIVPN